MRGGIFYKMKASKKVDFIERVDKSYLGLEGLQIVVNCDKGGRTTNDLEFAELGKKCLETINAKYVQEKYNLEPGVLLGKRLREERISWMRKNVLK